MTELASRAALVLGVLLVIAHRPDRFSRLYLGAHWRSDVLGGFALGGAWLTIVATVSTTYHRRRVRARRSAR